MGTYKVKMSVLILAAFLCLPTAVFARDLSACFGTMQMYAIATGDEKSKNYMEQTEFLYFKAYQMIKGKHDPHHKTWEDAWEFGTGLGFMELQNYIKPVLRQSEIDRVVGECTTVIKAAGEKVKHLDQKTVGRLKLEWQSKNKR